MTATRLSPLYLRFLVEATDSCSTPLQPNAFRFQPHSQLLPTAVDHGNDIKQPQGTCHAGKDNSPEEATDPDFPTNSRKRKWFRTAQGLEGCDVPSYRRAPQPPAQLGGNSDSTHKHRLARLPGPVLPPQTLLPDLPTSNDVSQRVEPARGHPIVRQAVFAAAFESGRQKIRRRDVQHSDEIIPRLPVPAPMSPPPFSSPLRALPDTHQVLQENLATLDRESRTSARPSPSSPSLSTTSTYGSGILGFISSESQLSGSVGRFTSPPSQIDLEDNREQGLTTDSHVGSAKQAHKNAIFRTPQNSDSALSDSLSSASEPAFLTSRSADLRPRRRGRPRKPRRSAHEGRHLLSPVVRRRRRDLAAKTISNTNITTTPADASSLVNPSQQARREVNRGYVNYSQTPRGSETLASIFDGDLSDLEEDQAPLSKAVPDSTLKIPPEPITGIRLNTMWRTVAPLKVPQQHRERLAAALKGPKSGACGAANTITARNAVLARAKKAEQGGISGHVGNSDGNIRPYESQSIADTEITRVLELLTLIRSPPEREQK